MAWTFVAHRGSANNKTSANQIVVSPSANLAVGSIIIVRAVTDATTHNSVADDKGNSWTLLRATTFGVNCSASLWASKITTQILTTDSITLNLAAAITAKVIAIEEFSVAAGKTFSKIGDNSATGTSTTPSVTLSGLASAEYLWLGHIGIEGPNGDTFTQDADYANNTSVGTTGGADATNVASRFGSRIFTGTSDTFDSTLGTSRDWIAQLTALEEVTEPLTLNITGNGGTGSVGIPISGHSLSPTGNPATATSGNLLAAQALLLGGLAASGAVGNVVYSTDGAVSVLQQITRISINRRGAGISIRGGG